MLMHRLCFTAHLDWIRRSRPACRQSRPCSYGGSLLLLALIATLSGALMVGAQTNPPALTLDQLRNDANLTPERFGRYFRDFDFKLGEVRQPPKDFLAARSGDCDDFACLAAEILREKKYTTKLVAVFMKGQTHVVCYVDEIHGYLDYNLRKQASAIQTASADLEDIADKVAAYFRNPWGSASEFEYEGGHPRFGRFVFASAAKAPLPGRHPGAPVRQTASCAPASQTLVSVSAQGL